MGFICMHAWAYIAVGRTTKYIIAYMRAHVHACAVTSMRKRSRLMHAIILYVRVSYARDGTYTPLPLSLYIYIYMCARALEHALIDVREMEIENEISSISSNLLSICIYYNL